MFWVGVFYVIRTLHNYSVCRESNKCLELKPAIVERTNNESVATVCVTTANIVNIITLPATTFETLALLNIFFIKFSKFTSI